MWHRFKRHKVGMAGLIIFTVIMVLLVFAEFFAPYGESQTTRYASTPPQSIHIRGEDGKLHTPFVYGLESEFNLKTGEMTWTEDTSKRYPLKLFIKGEPYRILGMKFDLHFIGAEGGDFFLFGTNSIGQDVFSRVLYGGRISIIIAFITAVITLFLGTLAGMISGYFQGAADMVIQRIVELFLIIPNVPLGLALAAFLPADMSPVILMLGVALVLSVVSWGNVARQVRGKTLAARESGYVRAAVSMGASTPRILFRHILPSLNSHLIVLATLTIPQTILAESGLSFLGFGLRPPMTSWGTLLKEAQNFRVIALYPWIMIPGLAIMLTVLSLNFIGDALRDATDPYSRRQ